MALPSPYFSNQSTPIIQEKKCLLAILTIEVNLQLDINRLLNNDPGDDVEDQTFFTTLLAYGEKLVIGILNLILVVLEWVLAFLK